MARAVRSCMQSLLKFANSLIGMVGVFMILYSIWMIRDWERRMPALPFDHSSHPTPWFVYTVLGLGVSMCVIIVSGHIAAETANACCLYLYMFLVFVLVALEAAVTVDVFLNRNWQKDFPTDVTGNLDKLKEFVWSDFEMCKWIGLSVVSIQGFCIFLAMVLIAVGPHERYCDSDDEYILERAPLLRNPGMLPSYVVNDPTYGSIQK